MSERWDEQVDVVVVGTGAAGAAAAIAASEAGAKVLVLEKTEEAIAGGNTRLSGSCWFENRDPERAKVYLRSLCAGHPVPEPVVEVWANETARNTEWLRGLGARAEPFDNYAPEYPELPGSDCYAGYMAIDGKAGDSLLYKFLAGVMRQRSIGLSYSSPASDLVQDAESGRIVGVVAERGGRKIRIGAKGGVVLATGGFENNPQMVSDYLGLSNASRWGTPAATGDGHRMALRAGADLWHMNNMMAIIGFNVPDFVAGFAAIGLPAIKEKIFVGPDGTRFVDEQVQMLHGHAKIHGVYQFFPSQPMHVIFDDRGRRSGPLVPPRSVWPISWNILIEGYEWSEDNSVEIAKGWLRKADTIEELAGQLGVDPARLADTVARYNRWCDEGRDLQFDRAPDTLAPLREPPYYAFTSAPLLAWSNGGPRRDEGARVLDTAGRPIPGLYAAGTVSSTYSWCKDGGFHIADALAFGRVAGRNAAAARN